MHNYVNVLIFLNGANKIGINDLAKTKSLWSHISILNMYLYNNTSSAGASKEFTYLRYEGRSWKKQQRA